VEVDQDLGLSVDLHGFTTGVLVHSAVSAVKSLYFEVSGTKVVSNYRKARTSGIKTIETYFSVLLIVRVFLKCILESNNNREKYTKIAVKRQHSHA